MIFWDFFELFRKKTWKVEEFYQSLATASHRVFERVVFGRHFGKDHGKSAQSSQTVIPSSSETPKFEVFQKKKLVFFELFFNFYCNYSKSWIFFKIWFWNLSVYQRLCDEVTSNCCFWIVFQHPFRNNSTRNQQNKLHDQTGRSLCLKQWFSSFLKEGCLHWVCFRPPPCRIINFHAAVWSICGENVFGAQEIWSMHEKHVISFFTFIHFGLKGSLYKSLTFGFQANQGLQLVHTSWFSIFLKHQLIWWRGGVAAGTQKHGLVLERSLRDSCMGLGVSSLAVCGFQLRTNVGICCTNLIIHILL